MAKKKLGYVELEWPCPSCGVRNPGTSRTCRNCGAAMPEEMEFELSQQQELDTSAETAARVAAGPDFDCPYCGTRNRGDATVCSQCGGDLSDASRRATGKVLGAFTGQKAPDVTCPNCGASNPATALKCSQCGGALGGREPKKRRKTVKPGGKKPPTWLFGLLLAAFVGCVILVLVLTRGSSETVGVVSDLTWTYTVEVEELYAVTREAWHDEIPDGGRLGSCSKKVRRTVPDPVPGAIEVCGTPYVVDTGTGKGQVVQDCEYQVSDDWCTYAVDEWRSVDDLVFKGQGSDPGWPEVKLRANQRQRDREEKYGVVFETDGKEYRYTTSRLEEFREFEPGSEWILTTNALGGVTRVEPRD